MTIKICRLESTRVMTGTELPVWHNKNQANETLTDQRIQKQFQPIMKQNNTDGNKGVSALNGI